MEKKKNIGASSSLEAERKILGLTKLSFSQTLQGVMILNEHNQKAIELKFTG